MRKVMPLTNVGEYFLPIYFSNVYQRIDPRGMKRLQQTRIYPSMCVYIRYVSDAIFRRASS